MTHPLPVPLDVRLMNLTATLLLLGFMLLALVTGGRWLAHHPVFAIRGIAVLGDISHTSALTLRAQERETELFWLLLALLALGAMFGLSFTRDVGMGLF